MGQLEQLFVFIISGTVLLMCMYFVTHSGWNSPSASNGNTSGKLSSGMSTEEMNTLIEVISVQNRTIHALEAYIKHQQQQHKHLNADASSTSLTFEQQRKEEAVRMQQLSDKILQMTYEVTHHQRRYDSCNDTLHHTLLAHNINQQSMPLSTTITSSVACNTSSSSSIRDRREQLLPLNSMQQECERRYGIELIDAWSSNAQVWCTDQPQQQQQQQQQQKDKSELICYPYHQAHKKLDGRGADLFCEARNMVIDFSKVHGKVSTSSKPRKGSEYLQFSAGALQSTCSKTSQYQSRLFMPHHALMMRAFAAGAPQLQFNVAVDTATYLLARDEDCENSFHSTADFMNMFLVYSALGLDFKDTQVLLLDKYPEGPYHELLEKAFSTVTTTTTSTSTNTAAIKSQQQLLLRHEHYGSQRVLFKRLIFHLESPAALIFPKVSRPDPLRCYSSSLFQAYRKHVLQSFGLLDVKPPDIPTVTLSLRHRTAKKNVGRVMANEQQVIQLLQKGNMMNLNVIDGGQMSYGDQLKLIRNTNVLVGIHGAGLMFIMFAAEEAVLVEIHPSYRQDRHFRHAARMTGKLYMPLRSTVRESCLGSSDSVTVPIDEFERTIDGAVRIARNFDDGLSECGLQCAAGVLALDARLNNFYKSGERRGPPISTRFPCG